MPRAGASGAHFIDLRGKTVAGVEVIERLANPINKHVLWRVRFACGHYGERKSGALRESARKGKLVVCPTCQREKAQRALQAYQAAHVRSRTVEQSRFTRHREVRAESLSIKRMTKSERDAARAIDEAEEQLIPVARMLAARPRRRADCAHAARPCAFVGCKYHLYLDVHPTTGSIKFNFPDLQPDEMEHTCALDVADRGGERLEDMGQFFNVTRERARQLEHGAIERLRRSIDARALMPESNLSRGESRPSVRGRMKAPKQKTGATLARGQSKQDYRCVLSCFGFGMGFRPWRWK